MLSIVQAARFIKEMGNGRTRPSLIECITRDNETIELVVKCSTGCTEKEKNLALEALAAMLAADLSLPVPEPFIVEIEQSFVENITDANCRSHFESGCRYAFGSMYVQPGYSAWLNGQKVPESLSVEAAEVYVFDAIIVNSDRRPENPNCLTSGVDIAIFDHELTFQNVLFWKEPWLEDSEFLDQRYHIFAGEYFSSVPTELTRFINAWEAIPDERFDSYLHALPEEWLGHRDFLIEKLTYLKSAKANIHKIVDNALRKMR